MRKAVTALGASREAAALLGAAIRSARLRRHVTLAELAERVGVSKQTMIRIEAGEPSVAIGRVFDAAIIVGVPLFDSDEVGRSRELDLARRELALLPARAFMPKIDDDF